MFFLVLTKSYGCLLTLWGVAREFEIEILDLPVLEQLSRRGHGHSALYGHFRPIAMKTTTLAVCLP